MTITPGMVEKARAETDQARLAAMTDEEIEAAAAADPDSRPLAPGKGGPVRVLYPVGAIRQRLKLSQPAFAALIGVPVGTIRDWEQLRRHPTGAAAALLRILHHEPEAAIRALGRTAA